MKRILLTQSLLLILALSLSPVAAFAGEDNLPPGGDTIAKVTSMETVANGVHRLTIEEGPLTMGATYLFPNGKATVFLFGGDQTTLQACATSKKNSEGLWFKVIKINNSMRFSVSGKEPQTIYKVVSAGEFG